MNARIIFGVILIAIGVSAIVDIPIFKFIFALLLIWWGYSAITGRRSRRWSDWGRERRHKKGSEMHVNDIDEVYVFSGGDKKVISDDFHGGRIVCVFGGGDFDLSEVNPAADSISMEVVCVFGGVNLIVPDNWIVKSSVVSVLGGVSNKTRPIKNKNVVLNLRGAAALGGIEIVN